MFILKKGHQPGVYVPLRALFLVYIGAIRVDMNRTCVKGSCSERKLAKHCIIHSC